MIIGKKLRSVVVLVCFLGFVGCWLIGISEMAYRQSAFESGSRTPTMAQSVELRERSVVHYITTIQEKRLKALHSIEAYSFWAAFGFVAVLAIVGKRLSLLDKDGKL